MANLKPLLNQIEKWKKDGVTTGRLISQLDKWKKQYSLSRNEIAKIIQMMEI